MKDMLYTVVEESEEFGNLVLMEFVNSPVQALKYAKHMIKASKGSIKSLDIELREYNSDDTQVIDTYTVKGGL